MDAITRETALQLCQEIRQANRGKWYTYNGLWCWGCSTFSRGNPDKLCFASRADCRGCAQVNARYDAMPRQAPPEPPPAVRVPRVARPAIETPEVIYLPPAGFSAPQKRRTCAGCGRPFRVAGGQPDAQYCPTCDYRRLRGQLIQQDTGSDAE